MISSSFELGLLNLAQNSVSNAFSHEPADFSIIFLTASNDVTLLKVSESIDFAPSDATKSLNSSSNALFRIWNIGVLENNAGLLVATEVIPARVSSFTPVASMI